MTPPRRLLLPALAAGCCVLAAILQGTAARSEQPDPAAPAAGHAFLATGAETYIRDAAGATLWTYPHPSRDGWVLKNGNVLLALSKSETHPGGGAVEVTRDGDVVFEFEGTQAEVNTVQKLDGGRVLVSEAGDAPRLLEVDPAGAVVVTVPLKAQTRDHHLQTRMARKLPNGRYLVPQLLDKVVREYTPAGEVVWEAATPNMPFTAIRLPDGNTLVGCTHGNLVVELDPAGEIAWRLDNDDLLGRPINDACGVQRLPNGNTIVASHHATGNEVKLFEVTRDKQIVWAFRDEAAPSLHHFQILTPDGRAGDEVPLR